MANKRTGDGKRKTTKTTGKTHPEQVSGISAAAIEGASQGASESTESSSDNAEKMARPGPGMDIGRQMHRGSPPNDATHAPESGTERDIESEESHREPSGPDEF